MSLDICSSFTYNWPVNHDSDNLSFTCHRHPVFIIMVGDMVFSRHMPMACSSTASLSIVNPAIYFIWTEAKSLGTFYARWWESLQNGLSRWKKLYPLIWLTAIDPRNSIFDILLTQYLIDNSTCCRHVSTRSNSHKDQGRIMKYYSRKSIYIILPFGFMNFLFSMSVNFLSSQVYATWTYFRIDNFIFQVVPMYIWHSPQHMISKTSKNGFIYVRIQAWYVRKTIELCNKNKIR